MATESTDKFFRSFISMHFSRSIPTPVVSNYSIILEFLTVFTLSVDSVDSVAIKSCSKNYPD